MSVLRLHSALKRSVLLLLLPLSTTTAEAIQLPAPLVETGWLADHLDRVVVLDVRKDGKSYAGKPLPKGKPFNLKKLTGHIPGAVSVPWKGFVAKGKEEGAIAFQAIPPV